VKLKNAPSTSLLDIKRKYAGLPKIKRSNRTKSGIILNLSIIVQFIYGCLDLDGYPRERVVVKQEDDNTVTVGLNRIALPLTVRFRDDDTKRGKINKGIL